MDLAKKYVKGISRKYDKLPVYYPGRMVRVGDVISFGKNVFGGPKSPYGEPNGSHGNVLDSKDYIGGDSVSVSKDNANLPYNFVSANEVSVDAGADGNVPGLANGDFKFKFEKEGSTLLLAKGTDREFMDNLGQLQKVINLNSGAVNWREMYIVTELEIAERALIVQSNSSNNEIFISTNLKNIGVHGNDLIGVDADVEIKVNWASDHMFNIPWTKDVTLFMKLHRVKSNGDITGLKGIREDENSLVIEEVQMKDFEDEFKEMV